MVRLPEAPPDCPEVRPAQPSDRCPPSHQRALSTTKSPGSSTALVPAGASDSPLMGTPRPREGLRPVLDQRATGRPPVPSNFGQPGTGAPRAAFHMWLSRLLQRTRVWVHLCGPLHLPVRNRTRTVHPPWSPVPKKLLEFHLPPLSS